MPTAPSSKLPNTPSVTNTQNDVKSLSFHLSFSSSNDSLIIHTPTPQKTTKMTHALNGLTPSKIAIPIPHPNKGSNPVDTANASAILIACFKRSLVVSDGRIKQRANARAKSSNDNPNAKSNRERISIGLPRLDVILR